MGAGLRHEGEQVARIEGVGCLRCAVANLGNPSTIER